MQKPYKVSSGEAKDVLALGDFNELIWKTVGRIALLASWVQRHVKATHCVVAHLQSKAIFLAHLLYQLCCTHDSHRHCPMVLPHNESLWVDALSTSPLPGRLLAKIHKTGRLISQHCQRTKPYQQAQKIWWYTDEWFLRHASRQTANRHTHNNTLLPGVE